jgi:hypothetical protein
MDHRREKNRPAKNMSITMTARRIVTSRFIQGPSGREDDDGSAHRTELHEPEVLPPFQTYTIKFPGYDTGSGPKAIVAEQRVQC